MPVRKVSGENSRTRVIRKEKMDEVGFAVSILQQEAHALTLMARGLTTTFCEIVDCLYNIKGRIAVTGMGKSGHVARKVRPDQPKRLVNVIKCTNPRCITSLETGCDHIFALTPSGRYRCVYCEQEFKVRP